MQMTAEHERSQLLFVILNEKILQCSLPYLLAFKPNILTVLKQQIKKQTK